MSVIPGSLLRDITDRMAKQHELLVAAYATANAAGGGRFYPRIHQAAASDGSQFDVEDDLINSANVLDSAKITDSNLATHIWRDMVSSLRAHASNESYASFDALISGQGVNVSNEFATVHEEVIGSKLDAINVFTPTEVLAGTVDFTGSGIATYTDGIAIGSGSGDVDDSLSAPNFDKAMLHAITQGIIGANSIVLDLELTNSQLAAESQEVTIPNGTAADTRFSVGTSGTDYFFDVTGVNVAGGSNLDQVKLYWQPERTIAL